MFGKGCKGCNFQHDFGNIYIDDMKMEDYFAGNDTDVNYIEIEPVTGIMTSMARSYTMVLTLYCYTKNSINECSNDN